MATKTLYLDGKFVCAYKAPADQPVGWVELLRNPSPVAISAAAVRDRLSEQSSKDRGVADRIAGDGFRKGSTHPTH